MDGFYKKTESGEWWYAPNFVYHKEYTLERDGNRESVDGWEWHDEPPKEYLDWLKKEEDGEVKDFT
jgi:hypothetical protein